jgi:hypothetical protein
MTRAGLTARHSEMSELRSVPYRIKPSKFGRNVKAA